MDVSLVVVEGRPQGAVIPLKVRQFVIGRDETCHLRPKTPTVSKHHCAILRQGHQVTVRDLGSTNGTLVNDRCLRAGEEVAVNDGDRLQVGQLIFVIRISAESPQEVPRPDDWLMPSGPAPGENPNLRTLLLSAVASEGPSTKPPAGERMVPAPANPTAKFSFLRTDPVRRVASIGMNQTQLAEESEIRAVRRTLVDLIARQQYPRMVLDLGGVDSLPSMASAMILALANRCKESGGGLRLCGLQPAVKRVVTALKLDRVAAFYPDHSTAVAKPWS